MYSLQYFSGQIVNIVRNSNGEVVHHPDSTLKSDYTLGSGVLEVDPSKAGIGFCFNSQDKSLYEVQSNDAELYHAACYAALT